MRSRAAFASGVAGLVGAILLLSGRFDGSATLAIFFVWGARVAADASLATAGPILAADARRRLVQQARFAPAWAIVVAAAVIRAGSSGLAEMRGANGVAGIALARGPLPTVAGVWCALAAGALALATRSSLGAETVAPPGSRGRIRPPAALRRLEAGGVLGQAGILTAFFVGPQVRSAPDAGWWAGGIIALLAIAWAGPLARIPKPAALAAILAAAGLALVIAGGAP